MVTWSASDLAKVKDMVERGYTASHIASDFRVSRNSIAGLIHRHGFTRPVKPRKPPTLGRPATSTCARSEKKRAEIARQWVRPVKVGVLLDQSDTTRAVMHLRSRVCRMPIGDPREPGFRFCMEDTREGETYCVSCHPLVYQPRVPRAPSAESVDTNLRRQLSIQGKIAKEKEDARRRAGV